MSIFDRMAEILGGDNSKTQAEVADDERDIVAHIKSKVEEARMLPARIAFESQVVTNTAYVLGFDSLYFDSRSRQFRSTDSFSSGPKRNKIHINLILPTVQNRLARLCKNSPRYDVLPDSMSQDIKDAARLSLKALNNKWNDERMNEKRIELGMWQQQAGFGYLKTSWDTRKGRAIPDVLQNGESTVEYEGDIRVDVVSPLEVFVDPHAKDLSEAQWVIHAKVRKLAYFRDQYPEKGGQVKEEGAWLLSIQNAQRIQQMNQKGSAQQGSEAMKNSAIELAYYERPSKKYPGGRMIITANGVLLEYKDLPIDEIPFVKFDDVKIAGKYYSESIVTHLRPIQDQMNRNMRRKGEFLNKGLNLKILAAKGHGISEESLNDSTEVVQYNPVPNGQAPQPMTPPQMPSYVYTDTESLRSYFSEISGISEVSKGQIPSASIPGIGMQILQEADETRVGITVESNENSYADLGRMILKFMNNYYTTERYIKESGANSEYSVQTYTKDDLKNQTDVVVIKGSTLPNSKTLKRQELLNVYSQGLLGDPADPSVRRRLLQQLEFGDVAGVWEDQMIDDSQIKRTIEQIEQGLIPEFSEDDNHQAHYDAKNKIRKSEKFLNYPPMVQEIFLQDLAKHKSFLPQFQPPPLPMQPAMGEAPQMPTEEPPMPVEPTPEELMNLEQQGVIQ